MTLSLITNINNNINNDIASFYKGITNEDIENFNGFVYLKPNDDAKNIIFQNKGRNTLTF